jgi:holo-[acyl-carrier protein] synthase
VTLRRWGIDTRQQQKTSRFAAKEAAIKAHMPRRLTFHDITIITHTAGSPQEGGAPSPDARSQAPFAVIRGEEGSGVGDQRALVSISHDGHYATAVCLGFTPGQTMEP